MPHLEVGVPLLEFDHVADVGGDPRADDTLVDLLRGGERQVFCRCHVTDKIGAVRGGECGPDRGHAVIVAGRDIGDKRTEHVERFPVRNPLLQDDVGLDLVDRDMPRSLDDCLDTLGVCLIGKFCIDEQFLDLGTVSSVVDRTRPHTIAKGEGDLVLLEDLDQIVELRVERVLFLVVKHPCGHKRAASGHESTVPPLVLQALHRFVVDPGVDRHEVGPELRLLRCYPKEVILFHMDDRPVLPGGLDERLVERDRPDRKGGRLDDAAPDLYKIPAGGEFHQRIGAGTLGLPGLLDLHINIDDIRRRPDTRVDLGPEPFADTTDLYLPVRRDRNDDMPSGHAAPDKIFRYTFRCCDDPHLLGDDATLCVFYETHGFTVGRKSR